MNDVVVAEVLHASTEVLEDAEEVLFLKPVAVGGVVQQGEEAAACAQLHHQHLAAALHVFLHGQQADNVLVVHLVEHLELSHLHLQGAHLAHLVEGLHCHGLPRLLVHALVHGTRGAFAQHGRRAPDVVGGASQVRHAGRARLPFVVGKQAATVRQAGPEAGVTGESAVKFDPISLLHYTHIRK